MTVPLQVHQSCSAWQLEVPNRMLHVAAQMSMHVPHPLAIPASVWWGPLVPVLMKRALQIHPTHALAKQDASGTLSPDSVTVRCTSASTD